MSVRLISLFIAALTISVFSLLPLQAAQAEEGLNETQRKEVETLVRDYLRENPEVLVEAIQALREKQAMAERNQAQAAVMDFNARIADGLNAPTVGPANASVTVVEFFDYRCGYCKRVHPAIKELLASDSDIRFVFMEFPILGDESTAASQAALAVWLNWPDRYMDVHDALMGGRGKLTKEKVIEVVSGMGINTDALLKAMKSDAVAVLIAENYKLAETMNINGTPAFIIGDELVPGAISLDDMKHLIEVARNG